MYYGLISACRSRVPLCCKDLSTEDHHPTTAVRLAQAHFAFLIRQQCAVPNPAQAPAAGPQTLLLTTRTMCRDGILTAEALAHAVAPYLQLLGADSERRRLQGLALRALGPALDTSPVGGACYRPARSEIVARQP